MQTKRRIKLRSSPPRPRRQEAAARRREEAQQEEQRRREAEAAKQREQARTRPACDMAHCILHASPAQDVINHPARGCGCASCVGQCVPRTMHTPTLHLCHSLYVNKRITPRRLPPASPTLRPASYITSVCFGWTITVRPRMSSHLQCSQIAYNSQVPSPLPTAPCPSPHALPTPSPFLFNTRGVCAPCSDARSPCRLRHKQVQRAPGQVRRPD